MRIFDINKRVNINTENETELFAQEYAYYSQYNQYPVFFEDKQFINIYKNINVQIVTTLDCNLKCSFCIEKHNPFRGTDSDNIYKASSYLLTILNKNNIKPNISITGGEPTLDLIKLNNLLQIINQHQYNFLNLNTNGYNISSLRDKLHINLSLQTKQKINVKNAVVQKLITETDTFPKIMKFIQYYKNAVGFSFRGKTTEVNNEPNNENYYNILNSFTKDKTINFIQQKIGDHYHFEFFKYNHQIIRFTYANYNFLRQLELQERKKNLNLVRAYVILPNGNIYTGWNFDTNFQIY